MAEDDKDTKREKTNYNANSGKTGTNGFPIILGTLASMVFTFELVTWTDKVQANLTTVITWLLCVGLILIGVVFEIVTKRHWLSYSLVVLSLFIYFGAIKVATMNPQTTSKSYPIKMMTISKRDHEVKIGFFQNGHLQTTYIDYPSNTDVEVGNPTSKTPVITIKTHSSGYGDFGKTSTKSIVHTTPEQTKKIWEAVNE